MISTIVTVVYKISAVTCGLILIYAAAFLYKGEKNKIQDRLESWWIKIHDYRINGYSKITSLLKGSSNLTSYLIENIFGDSFFSKKAIWGSFVLTSASLGCLYLLFLFDEASLKNLLYFSMTIILPVVFFFTRKKPIARDIFFGFFIIVTILFLFINRDYLGANNFLAFFGTEQVIPGIWAFFLYIFGILLSIGLDFLFITLMRNWVRRAAVSTNIRDIIFPLILSSITGIIIFIGPIMIGIIVDLFGPWGEFLGLLGGGNTIAAIFGLSVFILSLFLVLQRIISPLIERLIYFLTAENILDKRKTLTTAGTFLIATAWPSLGNLFKIFFEIF